MSSETKDARTIQLSLKNLNLAGDVKKNILMTN